MKAKKVVVVGATGSLGKKIVKALLEQGAEVVAMVRATSNRNELQAMGVTKFVLGDMMDKGSLKEALSRDHGFDAIVASAAGYTRHSKADSSKTDTIGYQNLVDASKEAAIPRFVLISILECDKAVNVPHFHNKYLTEKYLAERKQPSISLRAGAFFDWSDKFMLRKIRAGVVPVFFSGVDYGTIYTPDLARYAALAATSLPDSELNTAIDVGWSTPANSRSLADAFEQILKRPIKAKPVVPGFVMKVVGPILATFSTNMHDMMEMVKWVNTGQYVSKNTQKQKDLFGDLPTIEEAVGRYCKDNGLLPA
jgi:uncharacterized protein YbjT (DUF2867 family)